MSIPEEAPRDVNHGRLFSESQIRSAFPRWCNDFKSDPKAYSDGDSLDGEVCADLLIQLMTQISLQTDKP